MAEKCIRAFRMKSTPQQKYLRLKNINDQTKLLSRTQINNVEKEKIKVLYVLYFTLEKKKDSPCEGNAAGKSRWTFSLRLRCAFNTSELRRPSPRGEKPRKTRVHP